MDWNDTLKVLLTEYGGMVTLSVLFCLFLIWLLMQERKDRKEAWKAMNKHIEDQNGIVREVTEAINLITRK